MADPSNFVAIALAAGQGTRMKSSLPKVLHPLLGRPMLSYPVQAALDAGAEQVVVVLGHGLAEVRAELGRRFAARVITALQPEQRGTGDAARCGAEAVPEYDGSLLILYGDAPAIPAEVLRRLIDLKRSSGVPLALVTSTIDDATGYGRILRDAQGRVTAIREQKDCDAEQARIREWNPGIYAISAPFFRDAVTRLKTANAQRELLLTDMIAIGAAAGGVADLPWPHEELQGVNDRGELAARERELRVRLATRLTKSGVTVRDPASVYIDADVEIAPDVRIESQVHLRGRCRIETGAVIDVGCVLTDVVVQAGARLLPYTVATRSTIGQQAQVGPFSHLRPDSELGPETHIGNFVETKKTRIGRGSKANHLSYLGDGIIGEQVNVGAGTIFCNYDGYAKHTTVLEDRAFIGSDSHMVAPVTVGKDSYVATGTTVTKDVPEGALAIGRARQENKAGLGARLKEKLRAAAAKAKAKPEAGVSSEHRPPPPTPTSRLDEK
jgi:bifunctional UDP-N-acetylglucosamine pyrophosphorylase / glucosamine-1-phosphate N-acetyltransferase